MTSANEHSQQRYRFKYDEYKYVREKRLDATSKKSELAEKIAKSPASARDLLNEIIYFLRCA